MYKNVFEEEFRVTTNMLDENFYLKLSSILDIAQSIAIDHADVMHIGFDDFITKDLIRVLIRNKVDIIKKVRKPLIIKAVTYPTNTRFVEFPREVILYVDDEEIVRISQTWCIYNIKDNSVETMKFDNYVSDHPSIFPTRIKRLFNKEELNYLCSKEVVYTYCDHNKHMNNTHYVDLYLDAIYKDNRVDVKSFQIEYLKQCYLNDSIDIYYKINESSHVLEGKIGDNKIFLLTVYF